MDPALGICRFGPFHLDLKRRRLFRGQERVWLPDRSMDVLRLLVANAGQIISMDDLTRAVWTESAVCDNSIVKAVSVLRRELGPRESGAPYIETLIRKGYRFVAPVEVVEVEPAPPDRSLPTSPLANGRDPNAVLEPHRAFMDGRAAIETLELGAVDRARAAFAEALRLNPDFSPAHIGMANACVLRYESTRVDLEPDRAALNQAEHHAHEACRLSPSSGHAWSTRALVWHGRGASREAIAAARAAIAIQPQEWRHHLRLVYVSWGAERLAAAYDVLSLCPQLALAHWFAASVFVARGALDKALEHLRAGCAGQDAQRKEGRTPFTAVGLHLLHGLVLAARGSSDAAREEFRRELEPEDSGQIYARECRANTWYAIGALALRENRHDEARTAFEEALASVPGHALAAVGLGASQPLVLDSSSVAQDSRRVHASSHDLHSIDRATVEAAALALAGRHDEAARVCGNALRQAETALSGWLVPVEPLLHVSAHRDAWAHTLAVLRDRAV